MEIKSNFQRLDGAEMRSRFDMHQTPPDILITNFSMLSIILMRDIESGMLSETRRWLNAETDWDLENLSPEEREVERNERIFHIIIDELHLYRGTEGTEIAYLLRLFYNRLGLDPDSGRIRFLASSASLEGQEGKKEFEDSQAFLKGFFGLAENMQVIEGKMVVPKNMASGDIEHTVFEKIGQKSNELNHLSEEEFGKEISKFIDELSGLSNNEGVLKFLADVNSDDNLLSRLIQAFEYSTSGQSRLRPYPYYNPRDVDSISYFVSIAGKLFDDALDDSTKKNSIKGLLIVRGLFDLHQKDLVKTYGTHGKCRLPRFRLHFFIRNIEGLWATLKDDTQGILASNVDANPFDVLFENGRISDNNKRVFDALYCENCGTTLLGGTRIIASNRNNDYNYEIITTPPEIEKIPEKSQTAMVENRSAEDYAVFWPKSVETDITSDLLNNQDWDRKFLGINDGKVYNRETENTISGLYYLGNTNNAHEPGSALPRKCPNCGADYTYRKSRKSPIRGFRTGFGKTNQVLAKELFKAIPTTQHKPRKLVAFPIVGRNLQDLPTILKKKTTTRLLKSY